jgi:hypothetical protein
MDLLGNENVTESGKKSESFQNQQYPCIYMDVHITECNYDLTGPYWIQILS